MERLLLENLAEAQAFDQVLQTTPVVDAIAGRYLKTVLFEPSAAKRKSRIADLADDLVNHYALVIQPTARDLGIKQARRILEQLGPGDMSDPSYRQRVLYRTRTRAETRLRIVQATVFDKSNTLENRLLAYWLEPGQNDREKVEQLRTLHLEQEERRRNYEREVVKYHQGDRPNRPGRPQLDYMSRLTADVKQGFREGARRDGTDAQTAMYVATGHKILTWVTVNAADACPDCRKRQGMTGDPAHWDKQGTPGAGKTVCATACFCMLVPAETVRQTPSLAQGLTVPPRK